MTNLAGREQLAAILETHRQMLRDWESRLEPAPQQAAAAPAGNEDE
jgi:DNA-binding transcriptional regulator YiaG